MSKGGFPHIYGWRPPTQTSLVYCRLLATSSLGSLRSEGRHTRNRTHPRWSHHLPGPLALSLPSLAATLTRPTAAQGLVHPPLPRLPAPEASRDHILLILISEDLTNRPHLSCPGAPVASRLLVFSALFSLHSQDGSVKSPTSLPQLPTHHHWTRHQRHPCPHGAQRNRQMTHVERSDGLALAWAFAALLLTITSIL